VTCITALGFRSEIGTALTGDIDLQVGGLTDKTMPDTPNVEVSAALERVKLGFFPVPGLDPRRPSTTFKVRDGDLMVQFLTADAGGSDKVVRIPELGTAAQPMPFMDYLSEEPMKAVLPFGAGILVNVPNPARLAWHKIIVAQSRPNHERGKSQKDVQQAADLLVALARTEREALEEAFVNAYNRGSLWASRLAGGLGRLQVARSEAFESAKPMFERHLNEEHRKKLLETSP
jgi:hypothetical protein